MDLTTLGLHLVAPSVASLVWLFILRRSVARAYDRGYFAGGFDSFPEHFERGRVDGHTTGFINGYTFGTGKPANELLTRLAQLRAEQ